MQRKGFPICPYYAIRAYVRNRSLAKRGRYQDGERDAGPPQRRVHTGYLRPRDHPGPASGGGYHGEYPLRCHLILSERFAVWVGIWVGQKSRKSNSTKKFGISKKILRFPRKSEDLWLRGPDLNRRPSGYELRSAVLAAAFLRFRGVFATERDAFRYYCLHCLYPLVSHSGSESGSMPFPPRSFASPASTGQPSPGPGAGTAEGRTGGY